MVIGNRKTRAIGNLWYVMEKKWRKSRFRAVVKIDKKQLEWLRENKDTKTIAGFLDKIINQYKDDTLH